MSIVSCSVANLSFILLYLHRAYLSSAFCDSLVFSSLSHGEWSLYSKSSAPMSIIERLCRVLATLMR